MTPELRLHDFLEDRATLSLQVVPSYGDFALSCVVIERFASKSHNRIAVWAWCENLLEVMGRADEREAKR